MFVQAFLKTFISIFIKLPSFVFIEKNSLPVKKMTVPFIVQNGFNKMEGNCYILRI